MVCKIFFCSELANISDKTGRKTTRKRTHPNAKCYAFNAKAIIYCVIWLDKKYRLHCATATLEPIH